MLPEVFAKLIVASLIAGSVAIPLGALVWLAWRHARVRGLLWLCVGLYGLPLAIGSVLYFVGLVVIPIVFVVSAALALVRSSWGDHGPTALYVALHLWWLAAVLVNEPLDASSTRWGIALIASSCAAFLAVAKIGRLFTRGLAVSGRDHAPEDVPGTGSRRAYRRSGR